MKLTVNQVMQKAINEQTEGNLEEAERLYQDILKAEPKNPDANHNLGALNVSLKKIDIGLSFLKTALDLDSNREQFWVSYIAILIDSGRFEEAQKNLKIAKEKGFKNEKFVTLEAYTYFHSGNSLKGMGRLEEAEASYRQAIFIKSDYIEAHYNLGNTLQGMGRLEEAEASYRQAISLKSDFFKSHLNLGSVLDKQGKLEEAEASFRQVIILKPDSAIGHNNLGTILQKGWRLEEAEASYRHAISLEPDYADPFTNLGTILHQLGRSEEAVVMYTQAITLKPDYAEAYHNLGNTLVELGRLEEAETSYSQVIKYIPNFSEALLNRGQILFDKGIFDMALKDFDVCNTPDSKVRALWCLYALGESENIYKRIELYSEVKNDNIPMAAFSSFFAETQKKDNANNFCKNPLEFLNFSNISHHIDDSNLFTTELIEELLKIDNLWEPSGNATRKGFQSKINFFEKPTGKINKLKSIVIDELNSYYLKFKNKSCDYIKKWPSKKNLSSWYVVLKHQGYQNSHIHPEGWLSGVIYLKVVPSLGKNEGAIEFSLNGVGYSDKNASKLVYQPKAGDIVFFPSSLNHRTIPFTTDTDRITVSFDLMPSVGRIEE